MSFGLIRYLFLNVLKAEISENLRFSCALFLKADLSFRGQRCRTARVVRDERFEGRILRSDQPRGWANVAINAIPKITGKITRQ